eukprot:TRINITY_DN3194_c0_g1_i1.p1 TRINITY_DN3194_c0_g1~~TRINITY_DN3194_c0_g1_i1.p1  ORF type:complete len:439 (+),score=120.11 TRINITY_DN3194_c0_g1_i1:28-1344(+)
MDLSLALDPQSEACCHPSKVSAAQAMIQQGLINDNQPLSLIYDLSRFKSGIQQIINSMPQEFFLHTFALKANPVKSLIEIAYQQGVGFEAASLGELVQALKIAPADRIVFDSPVKTIPELEYALKNGVYLNLDNAQEIERVGELVNKNHYSNVKVGLRVNPQIGEGQIKEMSTAGAYSKFGWGINNDIEGLYKAYYDRPWMNGIHVHVGSQGMPIEKTIEGIQAIVKIAMEVNNRREGQITFIDIGGGIAVNFNNEDDVFDGVPSIEDFANRLKNEVPDLMTGKFKVLTEFGRRYNAKAGFFLSRIEYNKISGGRHIASTHIGADLMVRTVFMPTKWPVRITVLNWKGEKKSGDLVPQDIAGPCCHGADIIAHMRPLPLIESGDYILIHDTGAYYYSAFSYYNSRQPPPIYGYERADTSSLKLLKKGLSVEETLAIFG